MILLIVLAGCTSRPEIIEVKPDYPRIIKYPHPELVIIQYQLEGDRYYTEAKYTDIINNEIKLKTVISKYEEVIDAYNKNFVDLKPPN